MEEERGARRVVGLVRFDTEAQHDLQMGLHMGLQAVHMGLQLSSCIRTAGGMRMPHGRTGRSLRACDA